MRGFLRRLVRAVGPNPCMRPWRARQIVPIGINASNFPIESVGRVRPRPRHGDTPPEFREGFRPSACNVIRVTVRERSAWIRRAFLSPRRDRASSLDSCAALLSGTATQPTAGQKTQMRRAVTCFTRHLVCVAIHALCSTRPVYKLALASRLNLAPYCGPFLPHLAIALLRGMDP